MRQKKYRGKAQYNRVEKDFTRPTTQNNMLSHDINILVNETTMNLNTQTNLNTLKVY